jgi:hypothetical protein
MLIKQATLKLAIFGTVLCLSSFTFQKAATAAPDARLPMLVQNYAKATIAFRQDPLRNSV